MHDSGDDGVELERRHLQATVSALKRELTERNTTLDDTQQELEALRQELEATRAELELQRGRQQLLTKTESAIFEEKITNLESQVCCHARYHM